MNKQEIHSKLEELYDLVKWKKEKHDNHARLTDCIFAIAIFQNQFKDKLTGKQKKELNRVIDYYRYEQMKIELEEHELHPCREEMNKKLIKEIKDKYGFK